MVWLPPVLSDAFSGLERCLISCDFYKSLSFLLSCSPHPAPAPEKDSNKTKHNGNSKGEARCSEIYAQAEGQLFPNPFLVKQRLLHAELQLRLLLRCSDL